MVSSSFADTLRDKQVLALIGLYSLSYFLILLNRGIYWDDWLWVHYSSQLLLKESAQVGFAALGPLHIALNHLGIWSYRAVTFVCYLLAAIGLWGTLKNIPRIAADKRLYLALIFAIFPVNTARITTITVQYALSYAFFFVGLFLFSEFTRTRSAPLRITSLAFLAIGAFFTSSLLFFCILPPAFLIYADATAAVSFRDVLQRLRKIPDFLLMPVAVFLMKSLFFKSYGLYRGYNTIKLHFIVTSPHHIASSFYTSFIGGILRAIKLAVDSWHVAAVAIVLTLAIAFALRYFIPSFEQQDMRSTNQTLLNIAFGLVLYVLAVFPYSAVGKYAGPWNWDSRNQLLLPLAIAWIIVFSLNLLFSRQRIVKSVLLSALLALFVCSDVQNLVQFQRDAYKQQSLLMHFKDAPGILPGTSFVVDDETPALNADRRTYSYYEYTGMFFVLFGDQSRFAIVPDQLNRFAEWEAGGFFGPAYFLANYHGKFPDETIKITYGPKRLDTLSLIRLMIDERANPAQYQSEISDLTQVTTSRPAIQ